LKEVDMAITGFHHCSFTVTNIERTVKFYSEILGLKLVRRSTNRVDKLGIALGLKLPKAVIEIAMMEVGGTQIEFIEYVEPKAQPCLQDPSIAGSGHIAFMVDDIYVTKEKIEGMGIKFNSEINVVKEGPAKGLKWVYFRDYDGITLEIVEDKKNKQ
jgi:catechol 2,3-dioxygenase-like lactoylglutathione lyase family enzyme